MSPSIVNEMPRYTFLQEVAKSQPGMDPVACELFLEILRTGEVVSAIESGYLATHKVTPGRFAVMLLLGVEESIVRKPSELAELIGVTRATMTGLLDTLERDNFVNRTLDPNDRRSMRVVSTPECRELLKKILPGYFKIVGSIPNTLTEQERADFKRLTAKIQAGLLVDKQLSESSGAGASANAVAYA